MAKEIKERPILMRAEMVNAVLEDRKSMTRRIIDPQPCQQPVKVDWSNDGKWAGRWSDKARMFFCPYGKIGERLWVRETWHYDGGNNREPEPGHVSYRADGEFLQHFKDKGAKWRPSIFMPRWASRILLEITAVSVERVQDISVDDVFSEGVQIPCTKDGSVVIQVSGKIKPADYLPKGLLHKDHPPWTKAEQDIFTKAHFAALWDSINGQGAWERNDFVWKICFKRVKE